MKKFLTLVFTTIACITFNAQERVNGTPPTFSGQSGKLTSATGWAYNTTDKDWVDYPNMIESSKAYKKKKSKPLEGSVLSSRPQNFSSIETKLLVYKDVKYYVLVVEKWSGAYKYPNLREGYYSSRMTCGYIFTEENYKKLLNMDKFVELTTDDYIEEESSGLTEAGFIEKLQKQIDSSMKRGFDAKFPVMKSEEGKIRFHVPYFKYNFEEGYFETDAENFNVILLK